MVMVSHTHEFIFLKTQKTAGTTVEMALERFCRPPGAVVTEKTATIKTGHGIVGRRLTRPWRLLRRLGFTDWRNHMPAEAVRKALGEERWSRYLKITSVRNPFDLAVSSYHYGLVLNGVPEAADFDETRRRFAASILAKTNNCDYRIVHLDGRFVADRAIRFERLAEDVRAVAGEIAPEAPPVELPHTKNTSGRRRRAVADYYDAALIAKLRKDSAWVFDLFGYPDRPGEAVSAPPAPTPQVLS